MTPDTTTLLGLGVDVCGAARWERAAQRTPGVLEAAFSPDEREWAAGDAARLALQWALKEAVVKALGCGFGALGWRDVAVRPPDGALGGLDRSAAAALTAPDGVAVCDPTAVSSHDPAPRGLGVCDPTAFTLRDPDGELPAWARDATWQVSAGPWGGAAIAVVSAHRGPEAPLVTVVAGRRPHGDLPRPARRRARSAEARRAACEAARRLLPGTERRVLTVARTAGPPCLLLDGAPLAGVRVSLSHCGDLVAAAVGRV